MIALAGSGEVRDCVWRAWSADNRVQ